MSAALALQKSINTVLRGDAGVAAVIGDRVFDRVGPTVTMPYVHMRGFQEIDDSSDCAAGWEVFVDLDVWSNAVGKPEASRAAMAVRDALHEKDLQLDAPYALVSIRHRDTNIGDGGDGILTRARMSFVALIERV